nr:hypothetical protein [Actinomycetales bacterium]
MARWSSVGVAAALSAAAIVLVGVASLTGAGAATPLQDAVILQDGSTPNLDGATFRVRLEDGTFALELPDGTEGTIDVVDGVGTVDLDGESWDEYATVTFCATAATALSSCPDLVRAPWFPAEGITGANHTHLVDGAPGWLADTTPTFTTSFRDHRYELTGTSADGECEVADVIVTVAGGTFAVPGLGACGAATETVWRVSLEGRKGSADFEIGIVGGA